MLCIIRTGTSVNSCPSLLADMGSSGSENGSGDDHSKGRLDNTNGGATEDTDNENTNKQRSVGEQLSVLQKRKEEAKARKKAKRALNLSNKKAAANAAKSKQTEESSRTTNSGALLQVSQDFMRELQESMTLSAN